MWQECSQSGFLWLNRIVVLCVWVHVKVCHGAVFGVRLCVKQDSKKDRILLLHAMRPSLCMYVYIYIIIYIAPNIRVSLLLFIGHPGTRLTHPIPGQNKRGGVNTAPTLSHFCLFLVFFKKFPLSLDSFLWIFLKSCCDLSAEESHASTHLSTSKQTGMQSNSYLASLKNLAFLQLPGRKKDERSNKWDICLNGEQKRAKGTTETEGGENARGKQGSQD